MKIWNFFSVTVSLARIRCAEILNIEVLRNTRYLEFNLPNYRSFTLSRRPNGFVSRFCILVTTDTEK